MNSKDYHIPDYARNGKVPENIMELNVGKLAIDHDSAIKEAMESVLKDEAVVGALGMLAEDEKPEKDRNFTGKQPE